MTEKNILIIDDDLEFLKTLSNFLILQNFKVTAAENGERALKLYENFNFPVVVTDVDMPIMDGQTLISHFNTMDLAPIIIVISGNEESHTIIDVMKRGVYDYLLKPVNFNELLIKINKSFETYELRKVNALMEKEKIIRLEQQLDFFQWRENFLNTDMKINDKNFLENMYRSFNQGFGFGSLVAIGELLVGAVKYEEEKTIVDDGLFELLKKNIDISRKAMSQLSDIVSINVSDIDFELISYEDLYNKINEVILSLSPLLNIKRQTVIFNEYKNVINCKMKINVEYFLDVVKELLINAMKYSKNQSSIIILTEKEDDLFYFSFINEPDISDTETSGIPFGYENLVFEPFFRISKFVQEAYNTLDFGIGLTKADIIIKKHNGKIKVFNIKDFSSQEFKAVNKINFKASIPIIK